jgi:hypothetical protein
MRRAAGALATIAALAIAREASAQCQGRPTDGGGYMGYAYGAAPVQSFATADGRVHYATSGPHAPALASTRGDSVPDTVAFAAQTGQEALAKYAEMGFKRPPAEGCASNGGDAKMDIYLVRFAGADGSTARESCNAGACASFVLVESTFSGRGYPTVNEGFRTVVTHELFHAVQNAYSTQMEAFWAEGTAQWAMKTLHPELRDCEAQLPAFFKEPKRSLDTPPAGAAVGYLYGAAVLPLFLSLRYGESIVREIFEAEGAGAKTVDATASALEAKGSSMAEAMPLFRAWNVATKDLAGTGGYPNAKSYPGITAVEALADGATAITSGLGSFAYRGTLDTATKISLETDATRNAGVLVPVIDGAPDLEQAKVLPADAQGEVLVVVAGITSKKTDAPFTIRYGAPGGSSGGGGGGGGGDGGCATAPSSATFGASAWHAYGSGALAALVALVTRIAKRRRNRTHAR